MKNLVQLISQCPVCGTKYKNDSSKLYASKKSASFVHLACHKCGGYFIALVMSMGKGTSTVGMITDLNYNDVKRLHSSDPISVDEIIEAHKLIHKEFHKFFK